MEIDMGQVRRVAWILAKKWTGVRIDDIESAVGEAAAQVGTKDTALLICAGRRRLMDALRHIEPHNRNSRRPKLIPCADLIVYITDESQHDQGIAQTEVNDLRQRMYLLLTDRERYVIDGCLHGDHLGDIGRWMGVTESRVCQIRHEAAKKLRHLREDLVA